MRADGMDAASRRPLLSFDGRHGAPAGKRRGGAVGAPTVCWGGWAKRGRPSHLERLYGALAGSSELLDGLGLDLADAFAADLEAVCHLFEG